MPARDISIHLPSIDAAHSESIMHRYVIRVSEANDRSDSGGCASTHALDRVCHRATTRSFKRDLPTSPALFARLLVSVAA